MNTTPATTYTFVDVVDAWETGKNYGIDLVAVAIDDVRHSVFPLPRLSHEERVQRRIREMERSAEVVARQIAAEMAGAPRRPWGWSS